MHIKTNSTQHLIEKSDLEKLSTYFKDALNNPIILRWSVYFNLAIYFLFRGQEVHHQLKLDLFTFHTDENGEYAMIRHENQPKTHQTALENVEMNVDKRMYATGTDTCPVKMFKLLIEKNDESATCLFNKYTSDAVSLPNSTSKWFINAPLQKTSAGQLGYHIYIYTGHCLRATVIQHLMMKDTRPDT